MESHKKASAYIHFIGLRARLPTIFGNRGNTEKTSEGQLYVLARTGTTVTSRAATEAAGIGEELRDPQYFNSWPAGDMYGHGVNMHFGSQSNPDYWGGTMAAISGNGGAGISSGQGGSGEKLYFYSGTVQKPNGGRWPQGIGGGSYKGAALRSIFMVAQSALKAVRGGASIGSGCWTAGRTWMA